MEKQMTEVCKGIASFTSKDKLPIHLNKIEFAAKRGA